LIPAGTRSSRPSDRGRLHAILDSPDFLHAPKYDSVFLALVLRRGLGVDVIASLWSRIFVRKRKLAWRAFACRGRGHQRGFFRVISTTATTRGGLIPNSFLPVRRAVDHFRISALCWLFLRVHALVDHCAHLLRPRPGLRFWTPAGRRPIARASAPSAMARALTGVNGFSPHARFVGSWQSPIGFAIIAYGGRDDAAFLASRQKRIRGLLSGAGAWGIGSRR